METRNCRKILEGNEVEGGSKKKNISLSLLAGTKDGTVSICLNCSPRNTVGMALPDNRKMPIGGWLASWLAGEGVAMLAASSVLHKI